MKRGAEIAITVQCPSCGQTLEANDELGGMTVRCPNCHHLLSLSTPSRSHNTQSKIRPPLVRRWLLVTLGLVVALFCVVAGSVIYSIETDAAQSKSNVSPYSARLADPSFSDAQPDAANATIGYWTQISTISERLQLAMKSLGATEPRDIEELVRRFSETKDAIKQAIKQITNIPVGNADSEVVAYASEFVSILYDTELWVSQVIEVIQEKHEFEKPNFMIAVEALIRTAGGDPLGEYNDVKRIEHAFGERGRRLSEVRSKLREKANQISAHEITLRKRLTDRYHVEFPPIP